MRKKIFFVFCLTILLIVLVGGLFLNAVRKTPGRVVGERVFVVGEFEDIRSVARRLESDGLVASRWYFLWSAWRGDLVGKLQAGDYVISGNLTAPEVTRRFLSERGKATEIALTFPEGWTAEKMAERISSNGFDGEGFLSLAKNPLPEWRTIYPALADLPETSSLEGYLFPDTYTFELKTTPQTIVETMLENFDRRFTPDMIREAQSLYGSIFEAVVLASILEREIGSPRQSVETIARERRITADLFRRRIVEGMPLQSDATLEYVLGGNIVQHTVDDLQTDSPYNTYRYKGLPPGPIANPGLVSLNATLDPIPNEYVYFLNNPKTGETVFSRTFDEHKAAKVRNGL